ncbi:MAG: DUF1634 domain-containing protein [Terracidiphilus sp.]|jgi:uncharacterized membrane protein
MDDRRLETIIGRLLQTGVLLAAATVFAGGVLYLIQSPSGHVDYRTFASSGPALNSLSGIVLSAAHLQSLGLIQLGLLLLIATPVARVAMAVAGFALERDRLYTIVSVIVLLILAFSLIHAT